MAQNVVEYVMKIKTKAAEQGLDSLTDELEQLIKELTKADKKGKKSFDKTQKSTKKTTDKLKETQKQAGKTTKALTAIGRARSIWGKVQFAVAGVTAALSISVLAAIKITKKVTDLTNELNDLAVRSGITAKSIQGLRQALLASGQPASELNAILGGVAARFSTFSKEGGIVEQNFKSMGIAISETNGELRSNNDIMLDGIKKLQSIEDASERSRAAVLLFGKSGAKLNQALAAGNFEDFLEFTEKFGIDAGPKASKAAAEFQVALSSLQTVTNRTMQAFTTATDAQNTMIKGMIKFGGILAFTISLVEGMQNQIISFSSFVVGLIPKLMGLAASMAPLGSQFAHLASIFEILNKIAPNVTKVITDLSTKTGKMMILQTDFGKALNDAFASMEKYEKLVVGFTTASEEQTAAISGVTDELDNLGNTTDETIGKIRTFKDVITGLFARAGIKLINPDQLIADSEIFFKGISRLLKLEIAPVLDDIYIGTLSKAFDLTMQLDEKLNEINWFASINKEKGKFVDEIDKGLMSIVNKFSKGFRIALSSVAEKLNKMMGRDFDKNIANKVGNSLGKLSDKFGSLTGIALSKALTVALPVVGVLLKTIGLARSLGERGSTVKEVEKSVEEDIRARAKAIELGLQALPRILFNVLPPILVEFVDRLIFGLLKGFAETFNNALNVFKSLFTREGRQDRREKRATRTLEGVAEFNRRLNVLFGIASKRGGGPYIPSARGGIKFTGADEGLAMLHRGEFVVPETGQMPQAVQRTMGMGQSGINITINAAVVESNAVDELVRQIERRFQTFGSSTSPLFGGR